MTFVGMLGDQPPLLWGAGVGAILLGVGTIVFVRARGQDEAARRGMRRIAWPLIGCGGCLILLPVFVAGGMLTIFWLVYGYCSSASGC